MTTGMVNSYPYAVKSVAPLKKVVCPKVTRSELGTPACPGSVNGTNISFNTVINILCQSTLHNICVHLLIVALATWYGDIDLGQHWFR